VSDFGSFPTPPLVAGLSNSETLAKKQRLGLNDAIVSLSNPCTLPLHFPSTCPTLLKKIFLLKIRGV
jgi:hypothetical protein